MEPRVKSLAGAIDITERRQFEADKNELIAQADLKIAELNSLMEVTPAAIYIGNAQGVVFANSIGLAMLGFDSLEALNAGLPTLSERIETRDLETKAPLSPDDEPFVRAQRGETYHRNILFRNLKTGAENSVRCAAAPIYSNGQVVAAVVVSVEITESVRLQEEVVRSNELLNAFVASASDVVYAKDRNGRFLLLNPAAAALLNCKPQDAIGRRDADFLPPEVAAIIEAHDAAVMGGGATVVKEETIPTADGLRVFLSTKDPLRDAGGAVIGMVGLSQDITERKRIEGHLRDSEARLQIAVQAARLGAWRWDIATDELRVSALWREIFAVGPDAPMDNATRIGRVHPEDRDYARLALNSAITERADYAAEYRILRPSGEIRWVTARGRVFYGSDGKPDHLVGTVQDITESKEREAELDALNVRLQRAMQETHHRIKNNLQVISALTEIADEDEEGAIPIEAMKRIGQHTRALAGLHDILTAQAAQNVEADSLAARAILAKLIPMLEITSGGRPVRFQCDDVLLSQRQSASFAMLVSELVSNAIKHGAGLIEVSLRVVPASDAAPGTPSKPPLRLEVHDAGAGFPANFNPKKAANTGLQLIESMGKWDLRGSVEFTNRTEGGACVTAVFPQEDAGS